MKRIEVDKEVAIREWTFEDARLLLDLIDANRERLRWWHQWVDITATADDTRAFLEAHSSPEERARTLGGIVEYRGDAVGVLTLHDLDSQNKEAWFGYWLAEEAEGKGIINRGCKALIDIAFRTRGIHRSIIRVAHDNPRSRAVPERLGFTFEGYQREALLVPDTFHDAAVYSLLEHEWAGPTGDAGALP